MLTTIGYEKSDLRDFIATLKVSKIEVLVDIRERAQSRKPGFSKTALSNAVNEAGIGYVHLRELGDPKAGRDAARAGLFKAFQTIFSKVLEGEEAQAALAKVELLAKSKRICLMCYERDHRNCHRKLVSDRLKRTLGCKVLHLGVVESDAERRAEGRVLHTCESATT